MAKKLSDQEKARKLWVTALRSGNYGWGTRELHPAKNEYCCLGVLCEVAKEQGIIKSYPHHNGVLPIKVRRWVGLKEDNGGYRGESLASKNDISVRNPFNRIANLIENKPEGLFIKEVSK